PQTDWQTWVVDRCLECYLRGMTEERHRCLECHLRGMTEERQKECVKWLSLAELCKVDIVDRTWRQENRQLQTLKVHLERQQNRMKQQADKKRSDKGRQNNFSPKSFGPFKVVEKIRQGAYKLELIAHAQIHNLFYVSQLKLYKGTPHLTQVLDLPSCNKEGILEVEPIALLDRMTVKKKNVVVVYGLVQWANETEEGATWEPMEEL
ncbi:hypothetical protein Tco_0774262, partial [Tanacetum coccineum]